jgi:hypothetical protein
MVQSESPGGRAAAPMYVTGHVLTTLNTPPWLTRGTGRHRTDSTPGRLASRVRGRQSQAVERYVVLSMRLAQ